MLKGAEKENLFRISNQPITALLGNLKVMLKENLSWSDKIIISLKWEIGFGAKNSS